MIIFAKVLTTLIRVDPKFIQCLLFPSTVRTVARFEAEELATKNPFRVLTTLQVDTYKYKLKNVKLFKNVTDVEDALLNFKAFALDAFTVRKGLPKKFT